MDQLVAFIGSALPEIAFIPFFVVITLMYFPNYRGWNLAARIAVLALISPFSYMIVVKLVALGLGQVVALPPIDSDVYQVMVGTLTLKLVAYLLPIPLFTRLYAFVTKASLRICQFIYSAFVMMLVDAVLIGFDVISTFLVMFVMAAVWCLVFRTSITSLFFEGSSNRLRFYNFISIGLIIFAVLVKLAPQLTDQSQAGVFSYMTVDLVVIGIFLYLLTLFIYKNMLSNIEQYRQLEESKVKLDAANKTTIDLQEQMIVTLADVVGDKSGESGTHLKRVAESVRIIATEMGFSSEKVQTMSFAAMLHDVGKLRIPNEILHKPGKLTDEEFDIMKQHTVLGRDLLSGTSGEMMDTAKTIAMEHHERWDGGGYLEGLSQEDTDVAARITAVADVYDALVSTRSYKVAWKLEDAHDLIVSEKGKQFDPDVVDAFERCYGKIVEMYNRYDSETAEAGAGATGRLGMAGKPGAAGATGAPGANEVAVTGASGETGAES